MRIISGNFKSIKLFSPKNSYIRPTLDRAKEMIFSTLNSILTARTLDFNNLIVLDCFCGTGALGFECLSRGSGKVFFVDKSPHAINLVKKNSSLLGVSDKSVIIKTDFAKIENLGLKIKLFFIDPPYNSFDYNGILKQLILKNIVAEESFGVVETSSKDDFNIIDDFSILKKKKNSDSFFYFIERN